MVSGRASFGNGVMAMVFATQSFQFSEDSPTSRRWIWSKLTARVLWYAARICLMRVVIGFGNFAGLRRCPCFRKLLWRAVA